MSGETAVRWGLCRGKMMSVHPWEATVFDFDFGAKAGLGPMMALLDQLTGSLREYP